MNVGQGVTFEKDIDQKNQYILVDKKPQPFAQKPDTEYPEGWEEGLTSSEFLTAAKQMLWKKFNDKNSIS